MFNIKEIKNTLNEEHAGFAITFEVLITLTMIFTFLFLTLFVLMVMNGQRFMNTVLTSTAAQAARWGGVNTKAYALNVGGKTILAEAQAKLNEIVPEFNAIITGSPNRISSDGDFIIIKISYQLPNAWRSIGVVQTPRRSYDMFSDLRNMHMEIRVRSVMKAGRLL